MSTAMEIAQLPDDVREKLAELELELSEGNLIWLTKMLKVEIKVNFLNYK